MAKKVHKKTPVKSSKYKNFQLHGNYSSQRVFLYVVFDLIVGFVLGYMLQPTIVAALTSYASGGY